MSQSKLQRAQAVAPKERAEALRNPVVPSSSSRNDVNVPFLDAAIERFMLYAQDRDQSPLTVRNYRYSYRNFRAFLLDPSVGVRTPAERINNVMAWAAWNRKRQLSRFTVNMHWRSVRAFFKYLEAREGIPNPFRGEKAPGLPDKQSKALEKPDLRKILRAAESGMWPSSFVRMRSIAIIAMLIYTGLRKSELLHLTNGDVNLLTGWLTVVDGKGRYGGKSRPVFMPRALRGILAAYKVERARHGLGPGHVPEEETSMLPFFVSRQNRRLCESQFRRTIATVRRLSGIRFSAHVLRHSYITELACVKGMPLPLLQGTVGHANLETTAGYLRVRPEEARRYLESFDI
jgi:integrase/recombinase XerD